MARKLCVCSCVGVCAMLFVLLGTAAPVAAQTAPLQSHDVAVSVDSGVVENTGQEPAVVFSTVIDVGGATWLRLKFDAVRLGGDVLNGTESYLLITSLLDGAQQQLNTVHVRQWRHTSAYFNGDAVLIELVAHPGTGPNQVILSEVIAGEHIAGGPDSICGPTDDRVLSYDDRAARLLPIGCTTWLIDDCNHCFLTAGHCTSNISVVEFNVPLSDPSGSINHPGPEDQYSIDPASVQSNGGQGIGDDWGYLGCFPNSNTGLTPYEAQGDCFTIATPPPVGGQEIRITGYGTVSSPISPTWNQVQKTHVGPFVTSNGTTVQYRTDTTGGNSGSPVILEETGDSIGIHTHGGCTYSGGQNSGTGVNHSGLQDALAAPQGVCAAAAIGFAYPNGRPELVAPAGGTTMLVEVSAQGEVIPVPETGQLHYDIGGGVVTVDMVEVSPDVYEAVFPAVECLDMIYYFVSVEANNGIRYYDPGGCVPPATSYSALSAASLTTIIEFNFETSPGWTVENINLQDGPWERGVPIGGGDRGDPPTDYDGSGQCFLTDNEDGDSDVDGGPTRLISPTFDLSNHDALILTYARWFTNDDHDIDRLDVEISNDDGQNWTLIESVPDTAGWVVRTVAVSDFVAPTSEVKVRFSATDNPNNSVTEAGIDRFSIEEVDCGGGLPGDLNCDGVLNAFDIDPFVLALTDPDGYAAAWPDCDRMLADVNGDGVVNAFDIDPFVELLAGG